MLVFLGRDCQLHLGVKALAEGVDDFVDGLLRNGEDAAIVRWILMLARALGLRVVAEGVEEEAQAAWLHDHGCEEAQGYLYARALDAEALQARLRLQHADAAHD